ncbi:Cys-tRNA(Pro)/Cys-tRNA(Cys) deacylase [Dethiosulfatibacter aminovorans DSM 17477]|uniref:Cys-tRNA(Pro)/Cys-tRNA(Cys) deacylase n=1 Tax=Dethiosulfatibacter aminovorans DSM 17477 TaxID=1121476 RepID=A0A1M6I2P8_9FIRM|nr:Cys-tRNA(Pro) deacylase [Dethiosulfatibacter aminovorans]SHJ28753.1 Cys-tRNA(Pro)/Cys-tRNA(Cys) deacylase [Dethiosulfatibacter aminovorans DSM 17477]
MKKLSKTNAVRILEKEKMNFEVMTYDSKDGKIDGISVAQKIGRDEKTVYKTLVTQGASREHYVFIIPVAEELDLKKAAKTVGEKKVEMIHVKDIQKLTGYIRGGCSPVGMKKRFKTFLDISSSELEKIIVSGGKIGMQIEIGTGDLLRAVDGVQADLKK